MSIQSLGYIGNLGPIDRFRAGFQLPLNVQLPKTAKANLGIEIPVAVVRSGIAPILEGITFVPGAAITKDNTDYITVSVGYRRGTDNFVALATFSTAAASGTIAAFSDNAVTISANDLKEGDVLTVSVAKAATGQDLPASVVQIFCR